MVWAVELKAMPIRVVDGKTRLSPCPGPTQGEDKPSPDAIPAPHPGRWLVLALLRSPAHLALCIPINISQQSPLRSPGGGAAARLSMNQPLQATHGGRTQHPHLSLHDHSQVHSWMDSAVNVKGAGHVEWPDLNGVAIHLLILNRGSTRFCCRMRHIVLPCAVAQDVRV
jgi:hypothetical protein